MGWPVHGVWLLRTKHNSSGLKRLEVPWNWLWKYLPPRYRLTTVSLTRRKETPSGPAFLPARLLGEVGLVFTRSAYAGRQLKHVARSERTVPSHRKGSGQMGHVTEDLRRFPASSCLRVRQPVSCCASRRRLPLLTPLRLYSACRYRRCRHQCKAPRSPRPGSYLGGSGDNHFPVF